MSYNVGLELEDWHQQILGHRKAYKFICMWMAKTMQNLACKQCGIVINTLINRKAVQSCLHWGNKLWSCRLDAKAALLYLEPAGTCTAPYLKGLIHIATMSSNLVIKRASWTAAARPSQRWLQSHYAPKMVKADLSLLQKNKKCCLQFGLGRERREKGEVQLGGHCLAGDCSSRGAANRQRRKGMQQAPWFLPHEIPAWNSRHTSSWSFTPVGASAAKALPAQQVLWEIFTFVLPDINPARGESEIRGSVSFPKGRGSTHDDTIASWRGHLVWQNGKRLTFGKWNSSALVEVMKPGIWWTPVDFCPLPWPHHCHYKHRSYIHCLPTCFLAQIFILMHQTCTVYIVWHKSAVLWPTMH